jgi:hypothetical protein
MPDRDRTPCSPLSNGMLSGSGCSGSRRRMSASSSEPGGLARRRRRRPLLRPGSDLRHRRHVRVADVLDGWTRTLIDELDAVHLAELERGPITYRVFLLPDALQLDLSMTPAARFRPAGPRFRLLFGETTAGESETPTPPVPGDLFISTPRSRATSSGGASSTRSTRARVSSAGVAGRRSITSAPCGTTRSRSPASARGGRLRRRAATTTFPPRPSLDSRMPTSARSNPGRSGRRSPPPCSRHARGLGGASPERSGRRGAPRRAWLT